MREISFRGKRTDNGKWVYGLVVKEIDQDGNDIICIQTWKRDKEGVSSRVIEILPETFGEFTGLTDKNGKKIFEGDIIEVSENKNHKQRVLVFFEKGHFVVNHYAINLLCERNLLSEVIGNIHDNKELLNEN